jgi:hypothetical protein
MQHQTKTACLPHDVGVGDVFECVLVQACAAYAARLRRGLWSGCRPKREKTKRECCGHDDDDDDDPQHVLYLLAVPLHTLY